jgi:hypothetical protein
MAAKYERSLFASAPDSIDNCNTLRIIWPKCPGDSITIIGQANNYVRKDDRLGGNSDWPFVLKVRQENIGPWETLELNKDQQVDPWIHDGDIDTNLERSHNHPVARRAENIVVAGWSIDRNESTYTETLDWVPHVRDRLNNRTTVDGHPLINTRTPPI